MDPPPTYFTCTLGQAASLNLQQPHKTINALIDSLASTAADRSAVGFALPSSTSPWRTQSFTFSQIQRATCKLADTLFKLHSALQAEKATIALLCPSTIEFLLIWLALIRLGHSVLLIAPQCAPNAIVSLCSQCKVTLLLFDDLYDDLVKQALSLAQDSDGNLDCTVLPFDDQISVKELLIASDLHSPRTPRISKDDVAYLHHTSGTSSGMPKPIPQSHNAAVGVLPAIVDGHASATFTTTPLYHGGIADLFRAWTSSAMIWLFPGKSVPITASNVVRCLDAAEATSTRDHMIARVKYFSSVPYVLQLLESDEDGMHYLQTMELVGVGGAALPAVIGDRLVSQGVHLLSRFGSAECGFLLSSHRHYSKDREWQFLRRSEDQEFLQMELQDNGLHELVVLKGWPHLAKHNRGDESFATSDLFEQHPDITGAFKYHSRADSQLTLITGKKFDPAPLEAELAALDLLTDVVVFGNDQPYPGALLFRSAEASESSDKDLIETVWQSVEELNSGSHNHAKISRGMLIPMPMLDTPLEKSSKGTLLRTNAELRFTEQIEAAYHKTVDEGAEAIADEDLPNEIELIISNASPRLLHLQHDTDIFSAGVDSIVGMQIRSKLSSLLPPRHDPLPMTVVEDCGTIDGLARYISLRRHGRQTTVDGDDEIQTMRRMADEYSHFTDNHSTEMIETSSDEETVILTGATGALGAHLLHQYRKSSSVRRIYCLVRGTDDHASRERVDKALQSRRLPGISNAEGSKVIVLPVRLGDPDLGLDIATYQRLADEVTTIMHVAWSVNFRMRLKSFQKDNIGGLKHLLDLALKSSRKIKPVFGFCSSVASVMAYPGVDVPESIVNDPDSASALGYSRSKWVAEQICAMAGRNTPLRGRLAVFRVGQLAGDTVHGIWNASEAWPIMLSSVKQTKCLPTLRDEVLDWLPVDVAATSLIQGMEYVTRRGSGEIEIYHIVNYHKKPSWLDMIAWLQTRGAVHIVDPPEWVEKISAFAEKNPDHPAIKLVAHWREAYVATTAKSSEDGSLPVQRKTFVVEQTKTKIPALRDIDPIDESYFWKLWNWIQEEM